MIYALAFFAGSAVASPLFTEQDYQTAFKAWTAKYSKNYEIADFAARYETFKSNMDFVTRHNVGGYSYTTALNQFADMTNAEFIKVHTGYKAPSSNRVASNLSNGSNPSTVDWTTKGAVTPVKNQGQCGSCWAFSTTGSTEGANFIKTGKLVSLSEQQLVDCSASFGNQGCNGGLMDNGFKYIQANGICSEADYPYTGVGGTCQKTCTPAVHISGYTDVPTKNLDALETAAASTPVSIAVDASGLGWQLYSGGIYKGGLIPCGTSLDHGVLLVGYDTSDKAYWKVKNSWGNTWGESGFIRLAKTTGTGSGTCGLALQPSYPTIA
jgi:cathepsin L